jgi:hypothetical protein
MPTVVGIFGNKSVPCLPLLSEDGAAAVVARRFDKREIEEGLLSGVLFPESLVELFPSDIFAVAAGKLRNQFLDCARYLFMSQNGG